MNFLVATAEPFRTRKQRALTVRGCPEFAERRPARCSVRTPARRGRQARSGSRSRPPLRRRPTLRDRELWVAGVAGCHRLPRDLSDTVRPRGSSPKVLRGQGPRVPARRSPAASNRRMAGVRPWSPAPPRVFSWTGSYRQKPTVSSRIEVKRSGCQLLEQNLGQNTCQAYLVPSSTLKNRCLEGRKRGRGWALEMLALLFHTKLKESDGHPTKK